MSGDIILRGIKAACCSDKTDQVFNNKQHVCGGAPVWAHFLVLYLLWALGRALSECMRELALFFMHTASVGGFLLFLLVRDGSVMGFMSGGMVADSVSEGFCNYLNCIDQAYGVVTLGNVLGCFSNPIIVKPFGYIKPSRIVGVQGLCNNPFYAGEGQWTNVVETVTNGVKTVSVEVFEIPRCVLCEDLDDRSRSL